MQNQNELTVGARLDILMKENKGISTQKMLSDKSGVPQGTISRILKGDGKRGPESANVAKLAAACKCTFEWLMTGNGAKYLADLQKIDEIPVNSDRFTLNEKRAEYNNQDTINLPIMTVKQLVNAETINTESQINIARSWARHHLKDLSSFDNLAMVMSDTNLMEPTFFQGDLLAVDKGVTQFGKDGVYIVDSGEDPSIKRVQKMTNGQIVLICDNRLFAPEFYTREDFVKKIRVCGKVLCVWRMNVL